MAIDLDDEILQDFLVESGELMEQLSQQLVDLEKSPQDTDLLNAVFRNFHTVKGSAGFLSLNAMVDCCHVCEDVFNVLRQGSRKVTPGLMDSVLQGLDTVQRMFAEIRKGTDPAPAAPELMARLKVYSVPGDNEPDMPAGNEASTSSSQAEIPHKSIAEPGIPPGSIPEESSETGQGVDMQALLDVLEPPVAAEPASTMTPADSEESGSGSGEMTDDEFEALLDEIHGKGKGPTSSVMAPVSTQQQVTQQPVENESEMNLVSLFDAEEEFSFTAQGAASTRKQMTETTVRVDTERLDQIMNLVGELVLVRNRLQTLRISMGEGEVTQAINNLDMVTSDLQTSVMKTRMQPIRKVFGRFPRVVRDLSRTIKKQIRLEMVGEETDLDKNLVEALADPLVHLVRNAVDHGIELPEEREKKGKPREGLVRLTATQEGDHIMITIEDDGTGMDPEVIRHKAIEQGLIDEENAGRLSHKECFNLITMAGFSTKDEISDISGRGVGMDVVKTRITQLNGSLDINSEPGKGSVLRIKVPLTLAILPTLMIALGRYTFALPLANVNEIFELETRKTNVVDGQLMVMVRDKAVPLFYLSQWLLKPGEKARSGNGKGQVIIVTVSNRYVGLVTDYVIGQEEVVIKPLGALLQKLTEFAGSTITGDGGIALIIDVPNLLKSRAKKGF